MLFDVLTWIANGCKLYVKIIIIHVVLMFHVALIYTCDMKENALASCISLHGHIALSLVWVLGVECSPFLVNVQ